MSTAREPPGLLLRDWALVLAAPFAWATAHGVLFSLTDETCATGARMPLLVVAVLCLLAAITPLPFAWWRWRHRAGQGARAERMSFMWGLAMGASLIMALVLAVMLVGAAWMHPCRT